MAYALGIDLGTTATAAAVARGGRAEIVPLGGAAAVVPSAVLVKEDGTVLVGDAAARRAMSDPGRFAREFKRRIGDPTPLLIGGVPWSAEALMARLLRWTVDAVAEREGELPSRVAVTHPANWGPYKLDLLTQAVRLAEVKVDRYLTEPEAAAIAYAANERVEPNQVVAVYDLGGGTFDAAVLRTTDTAFEILGDPEGIDRLGGVDFDQAVLGHVAAALNGVVEALDPNDPTVLAALARLRRECVEAKEALSTDSDAVVQVLLPGVNTEVLVTRAAEFENMVRTPIADTVSALRRALRSAGVTPEDVSTVLLVGGSSRIPLVADMVGRELGRPVAVDAHPKHAVALGAALAAADAQVVARPSWSSVAAVAETPPPAEPALAPEPEPEPVEPEPVARQWVVPAPDPEPAAAAANVLGAADRVSRDLLPPERRSSRRTGVLAAAVVVVVGGVVGGLLLLGGGGDGDGGGAAAEAVAGVDPAAGAPTECPESPSVCITALEAQAGVLLADFVANGVSLADPTNGRFPPESVHPVFFFDVTQPSDGRVWGSSSPFGGPSAADLSGFTDGDVPTSSTSLCVLLQGDQGQVLSGTGNCAPLPT